MKNIFIILTLLLVLIAVVFLFVNKDKTTNNINNVVNNQGEKIQALSTFTIIADMVGEVGGDRVESISLTKPGVEIHGYEPTPSDLIRASQADIIFENGLNLELWSAKLRSSIPDVTSVVVSEGVEVRSIAEGAYEGKPNPHAWMSPKQGLVYVENIRKALVDLAPEHEAYFNANAEAYSQKLIALDKALSDSLSVLPDTNRQLVTCEGAFTYLAKDYGLEEHYIWAINDESGGSPQQVARIIDVVKEKKIPAVFCESTVEPRIQQEVVQATGAKMGGVLYVDSLSTEDGPAPTYIALLTVTVNNIIAGLTK
ncbi:MAG: putative periplasmic iron-binding protein precursor [Parcubacteria bacterium OLB19]|nr:MAG: putative periplasmic iron-binding protein precursor [Parcubacteria bacterium OLB19]